MGPPCGYFAFKVARGGCNGAALQVGEMPYVAQSFSLELYLQMKIQIVHLSPGEGGKLLKEGLRRSALCRTEGFKGLCNLVLKLPCPHSSLYPKKDVC